MFVFPIFRLPHLASKAIVDQMDLGDLTALFLCSRKTQKFIKSLHKSVSFVSLSLDQKKSLNCLEIYELFREEKQEGKFLKEYAIEYSINLSDDMGFLLDVEFDTQRYDSKHLKFHVYAKCIDQQNRYEGTKRNLAIGDVTVPVVMTDKNKIYTFWPKKLKGFKMIGEFLRQNGNSRSFDLNINVGKGQEFSADLIFIINWMNSTNQIPEGCDIYNGSNNTINEDDTKFILDNVYPTKRLHIWPNLGDQFQCNSHFKSKRFHLAYANWFTLENLLKTDCESIHFQESKLTNNDMKEYLKQWIAGKFPKLRRLVVLMQEDINIDVILSGLEDSPENITITRKEDSVYIKRNDEHVFEISASGRTPRFEVNITFNLRRF